jgi:deoxyadenosine/deoxycytidine kinase
LGSVKKTSKKKPNFEPVPKPSKTKPIKLKATEFTKAVAAASEQLELIENKGKMKAPKKKIFVAMAGNIGAGKTTAAKMVSQKFGFELFDEPVIDNRFLKNYYGDMKRWSFTLQLEFLIKRVQHHELIHRVPKSCIQDRTLYEDPEIFAKYLHGLGNMTDSELELYFDYFKRLTKTVAQPDKVICFDVPKVDVLLSRIKVRGREEEKGIQTDFLRGLNGYYATFPMVLAGKYGVDVLTLDVTNLDIRTGQGRAEFLDKVSEFLGK